MGKFVSGRFRPDAHKSSSNYDPAEERRLMREKRNAEKRTTPRRECVLRGVCPVCGLEGKDV